MRTKAAKGKLLLVMFMTVQAAGNFANGYDGASDKAIYGDDNRNEIYAASRLVQNLANSILGQFTKDILVKQGKGSSYQVGGATLGKQHCSSLRFSEQTTGPKCTAFLVAPNIIATAGHCMKEETDCANSLWAFDYKLKSGGDTSYTNIPAENVYSCKKILARKFEYMEGADYTLIQIDREVLDREPMVLDFTGSNPVGTPLLVLGHPSGLPMKYADSSSILKDLEKVHYSNLDTLHGNSGSPVFDANTGHVIGITSRGHADYVWNSDNTCKIVKVCTENEKCNPSVDCKITLLKDDLEKAILATKESTQIQNQTQVK